MLGVFASYDGFQIEPETSVRGVAILISPPEPFSPSGLACEAIALELNPSDDCGISAVGQDRQKGTGKMLGNSAICYQGIQRVFRNAMVEFLRVRLPRAFPNDHLQQMKRLFGDGWRKAAAAAVLRSD